MKPSARRLIYLWCAPIGCVVMAIEWVLLQEASVVQRYTLPLLSGYLLVATVVLAINRIPVVTVERSTFWVLLVNWTLTMSLLLATGSDAADTWKSMSLTVFTGLTILVVMAFLWFDTRPALINAFLAPISSTVVGLVYYASDPDSRSDWLIDLLRFEVNLAILVIFVYALARSKDALVRTRVEADRMRAMAYRDPLTGLSNRRQAVEHLERIVAAGTPAGLVLLDLDQFKAVNDVHGHDVGDAVLVRVAEVLRESNALEVTRWGGEEFLLLVDGGRERAVACAQEIRQRLAAAHFPMNVTMTASFGVADIRAAPNLQELLHEVDTLLYRAKTDGRDTVRVSDDDHPR